MSSRTYQLKESLRKGESLNITIFSASALQITLTVKNSIASQQHLNEIFFQFSHDEMLFLKYVCDFFFQFLYIVLSIQIYISKHTNNCLVDRYFSSIALSKERELSLISGIAFRVSICIFHLVLGYCHLFTTVEDSEISVATHWRPSLPQGQSWFEHSLSH